MNIFSIINYCIVLFFSDFISLKNGQRAKDADNYHYFAYDNKDGVSGRAYTGGLCDTSRRWRTAISEWIKSPKGIHYSENQCVLVGNKYVSNVVMPL